MALRYGGLKFSHPIRAFSSTGMRGLTLLNHEQHYFLKRIVKLGFLNLLNAPKTANPDIKCYARERLEYSKNKEIYLNMPQFMAQKQRAAEVAEIKYPKEQGWQICWVFNNSSCHNAMAEDALNVNSMNVKPGGAQKILRDTTYNGKAQRMYYISGGQKVAKGMKRVLEERGISTEGKNANWMRETLSQHADFKFEKSEIEKHLIKKGQIPTFLPKFHPELHPIKRV